MLTRLLANRKHKQACNRLARDVEQRKNAFETRDFAKRRQASLKRTPRITVLEAR